MLGVHVLDALDDVLGLGLRKIDRIRGLEWDAEMRKLRNDSSNRGGLLCGLDRLGDCFGDLNIHRCKRGARRCLFYGDRG
jgi:hypothetical protein